MPTKGRKATKERERKHSRVRALAAQLPEELFERILAYVDVDDSQNAVKYSKAQVGHCALVSKYWTPICQAKIFRMITLLRAEDVRHLMESLQDLGSSPSHFVEFLRLAHREEGDWAHRVHISAPFTPWFHLVPLLYPQLPRCHCYLWLNGPLPPGMRTLRTIHWNLSRTLPAHSKGLQELTLSQIHFASFGDLVHLLDNLQDLCTVYLMNLTWSPPVTRLRTHRPRCTTVKSANLYGCPDDEYALWLVFLYRCPPGTRHVCINQDFHATLVRFLQTTVTEKVDRQAIQTSKDRDVDASSEYIIFFTTATASLV